MLSKGQNEQASDALLLILNPTALIAEAHQLPYDRLHLVRQPIPLTRRVRVLRRPAPRLRPWPHAAVLLIVLVLVAIIEGIGYLVLGQPVPLLVAGLIAIILALPISTYLLRGWSRRINEDIAAVDSGRRTKKEDLRRRMSE